ncbi:MAG: hypothetical protein LBE22_12000, partial [Azoarcus sp.]|nr:hypothetical protein [Azoarcus sp.]
EPSLSEPGYRNALELQPNSELVRSKVQKEDEASKPGPNQADVLFVVETGQAPTWKSVTIPLSLPIEKEQIFVPLSFPVVLTSGVYTPPSIDVAGQSLPVETLVNVDAMAKRQLKDQMPGIIGRTTIRGIIKGAAQYAARTKAGTLGGYTTAAATVASEQADERAWRSLPARLSIARAILPEGEQVIEFRTARGTYSGTITVGGKINIVPIRIVGDFVYIGQQEAKGSFTELPSAQWVTPQGDESIESIQEKVSAISIQHRRGGGYRAAPVVTRRVSAARRESPTKQSTTGIAPHNQHRASTHSLERKPRQRQHRSAVEPFRRNDHIRKHTRTERANTAPTKRTKRAGTAPPHRRHTHSWRP